MRLETRVSGLERDGDGFRVTTDRGTWTCDNVVVATGTFGRTPRHGGPMLRVKRSDLAARGVERVTSRVEGLRDGLPVVDGTPREVANVVWATGFRQAFDWIHLPVLDEDGWPREMRGVVAEADGLFFCGLSFQYAFSSMLLAGAGRDAALVADRVTARMRQAAGHSLAA